MVHEKAITLIRDTATIKDNDIFRHEASSADPGLPRTSDGVELQNHLYKKETELVSLKGKI